MSETEFVKKGRNNQSGPESKKESNHVQMAAYCKKVNECDSVGNKKRNMLLGVNENRNKTFMNEMKRICR